MKVKEIYEKKWNNTICRVVDVSNGNMYGFLNNETERWIMDLDVKYISPDIVNGDEPGLCIFVIA